MNGATLLNAIAGEVARHNERCMLQVCIDDQDDRISPQGCGVHIAHAVLAALSQVQAQPQNVDLVKKWRAKVESVQRRNKVDDFSDYDDGFATALVRCADELEAAGRGTAPDLVSLLAELDFGFGELECKHDGDHDFGESDARYEAARSELAAAIFQGAGRVTTPTEEVNPAATENATRMAPSESTLKP
jgi:hypothetical protein